jgi:hypothetical protein
MSLCNLFLNKKATSIFLEIIEKCEATEDQYIKLNNNSSFMPLSVEKLYSSKDGKVFSFSHYYEQNGDLVPDPDITFLMYENKANLMIPFLIIPLTFQDYRSYQEVCILEGDKWQVKNKKNLSDLVSFSNMWMQNIKSQQGIKIERVTA